MISINEKVVNDNSLKETVLQFGEGNFLRAFVDWMIDLSNERYGYPGKVVVVQPIEFGLADLVNEQNGLYTLSMRGQDKQGQKVENRIIKSVSRGINPYSDFEKYKEFVESEDLKFVVSNTTEAGIEFVEEDYREGEIQTSFPAKVAQLLYLRYKKYEGAPEKGLIFLPVELIDDNGYFLKKYVFQHIDNWKLEVEFKEWIEKFVHFTSTLVDRIVTGRPSEEEAKKFFEEVGYEDKLLVFSELFNLWVIEGDIEWSKEFDFKDLPCNVIWTDDVKPYKKRKVRILNGGHTSTVPAAVINGFDIVRDFMEDEIFLEYFEHLISDEVIQTINLPKEELEHFKKEVELRFKNPYVNHKLLDITLNSISKFNARCLPSIVDYYNNNNEVPKYLAFSLAALIRLYKIENKDGKYFGKDEKSREYEVKDNADILEFFAEKSEDENFIDIILDSDIWEYDFDKLGNFKSIVSAYYKELLNKPIKQVMKEI